MRHFVLGVILIFASAGAVSGQQGGAFIVRVPDGAGFRCIDRNKDLLWITLRRVITDKRSAWFTVDKSVGIELDATVRAPSQPKPAKFPFMVAADVQEYTVGQISVPVEYTIVDSLRLHDGNNTFSGVSVEVTLLNARKKNGWGRGLQALADITKSKLPIPASPFVAAGSYLLDFANATIQGDISAQAEADKSLKSAVIDLQFDPSGQCRGVGAGGTEWATTGTIAIVQAAGVAGDAGYVPIERAPDYCWGADLTPGFVLKAALRPTGGSCNSAALVFRQVTNNYVGFFVNAVAVSGVLGGKEDQDTAERRCLTNGISAKACLAGAAADR